MPPETETAPDAAADHAGDAIAKRVAGNSLWLIGQPLLMNAISVLSTGYIARKLGAADYGTFNLGLAQIALFSPLCNLGVRAVAIRAIAQDRANAPAVMRAVYALRLLTTGAAVLLALAWLAVPAYTPATRMIGLAAVFSMVFTALGTVAVDLFQGFERSRLAAQPQMAAGLVLTALSVLALVAGLGLPGFVLAYVLGALLQVGLLFRAARRAFFPLRPAWDWPRIRDLARQARPFAVLSLLSGFTEILILEVMILGAIAGAAAVGPYVAAVGLVSRLLVIPFGIGDAIYPAVAGAYRETDGAVHATVRRFLLNVLFLTTPVALCLYFTAPTVLQLLFGSQYLSAVDILRAAAWLLPLGGLSYVAQECLSAVHRQDVVVRLSLVSSGLLVLLCLPLILLLGGLGAALAVTLREAIMLLLCLRALGASFRDPLPAPEVGRQALALGAMAVPLVVLHLHYSHPGAVLVGAGSFLCYGAAALALGLVNPRCLRPRGRKHGLAAEAE